MQRNKFLPFLIISLTLTAFLAGYIMVSRGIGSSTQSRTGTILDKFGKPIDSTVLPKSRGEQDAGAGIFPVSSVKSISIANSSDRSGIVYFEKNTGKLFEFNFEDNKERVISDAVLPNFMSSTWSPIKNEVLSFFYSPESLKVKYHNYNTGKTIELNNNIRSIAFSPDGGLLAYYLLGDLSSGESGKIYLAQTDGTFPKKILDTRIPNLEVYWPLKDRVAFSTPASEVFLLTETGELAKLLESKPGLDIKWSIYGAKLLFSYFTSPNEVNASLWLKDVESKSEKDLGISTLASKCAWSIDGENIFCAVAKTPSIDDIYQINTTTGSQKLIAEPNMPIKDVFLSALENRLLFTSLADEKIYGLELTD